MSVGLKKKCSTDRAPGASRKIATRIPSTTIVLIVDTTVALVPPPDSSRGPRPVAVNDPAGWPGGIDELGSMRLPPGSCQRRVRVWVGSGCGSDQGWMVGNLR